LLVTSLRWFGASRSAETSDALLRMSHLLLQAIAMHAVVGDKSEHEAFQADLARLQQSLGPSPSPHEILVVTGAVVKTMEEYNRRTSRFVRAENNELERIVAMLTATVASVSKGSERTIGRMQDIAKQIERASVVENLQMLRVQLGECLSTLRQEESNQRKEASQIVAQLTSQLSEVREEPAGTPASHPMDELTGLPKREQAIVEMEALSTTSRRFFLALFQVDRLSPITARYGPGAGDQVILLFCQHLAQFFDKLYRWNNAGFVAIVQRSGALRLVQEEVGTVANRRLEKTLHIGGRSVLLPVVCKHTIISATGVASIDLVDKVEAFLAEIASESSGAAD
jgi:GGDEF domain-containing protein